MSAGYASCPEHGSTAAVIGSGTVSLTGANSFTGQWLVSGGTLRLAHVDAVSTSTSPFTVGTSATLIAETASNYAGDWNSSGLVRLQHELAFRKRRLRDRGYDPEQDPVVARRRAEIAARRARLDA